VTLHSRSSTSSSELSASLTTCLFSSFSSCLSRSLTRWDHTLGLHYHYLVHILFHFLSDWASDCLASRASLSTSLPRSRARLASVLAAGALPLPRKFCLGLCFCLIKWLHKIHLNVWSMVVSVKFWSVKYFFLSFYHSHVEQSCLLGLTSCTILHSEDVLALFFHSRLMQNGLIDVDLRIDLRFAV